LSGLLYQGKCEEFLHSYTLNYTAMKRLGPLPTTGLQGSTTKPSLAAVSSTKNSDQFIEFLTSGVKPVIIIGEPWSINFSTTP